MSLLSKLNEVKQGISQEPEHRRFPLEEIGGVVVGKQGPALIVSSHQDTVPKYPWHFACARR